jgi:hypothetical protein
MSHSNRHQFEDETERQTRALGIFLRRKFKKATFGEIATLFSNFVLIAVGILAASIYGCQLTEIRRANDLTRQSIHSNGRAWIGIEAVSLNSLDKDDQDAMLGITFTLKNYGHSAAEHVRILPELDVLGATTGAAAKCSDSNAGINVGDVTLPDQKRDYPLGLKITDAEIESSFKKLNPVIGRNLPGLIVLGCLEYIDDPTEKSPHHTPFSYVVTKPVGEGFISLETKHIPGNKLVIESNPTYPGPTD